eukprot:SAG31_NODE_7830_length_1588_cov_1.248489_2_plen_133_part_00
MAINSRRVDSSFTGRFRWHALRGEANVGAAAYYACQFPAMIEGWREDFQAAGADSPLWFGFVQIAGWNYGNGSRSLAAGDLRQAQLAALKLPNVGMSTAIDTGVSAFYYRGRPTCPLCCANVPTFLDGTHEK